MFEFAGCGVVRFRAFLPRPRAAPGLRFGPAPPAPPPSAASCLCTPVKKNSKSTTLWYLMKVYEWMCLRERERSTNRWSLSCDCSVVLLPVPSTRSRRRGGQLGPPLRNIAEVEFLTRRSVQLPCWRRLNSHTHKTHVQHFGTPPMTLTMCADTHRSR